MLELSNLASLVRPQAMPRYKILTYVIMIYIRIAYLYYCGAGSLLRDK